MDSGLPGPGARPDGSGRRALSRAPALGGRSWLSHLYILIGAFYFVQLPLQFSASFPITAVPGRVHPHPAPLWGRSDDLSKKCQPGYYLSEYSASCVPCTDGKDFTNHSNTLSSCQLCSKCFSDKVETAPCTRTMDTQCQCKPGMFQDDNSPEFCQKCSPECPADMVMVKPCTPWNDLECVKQEPGTQASEKTPGFWRTRSLEPPITFPPSSGSSWSWWVAIGFCVVALLLSGCLCYRYRSTILQGCGMENTFMNRILSLYSCAPRGREDQDNVHNTFLSREDSPPTLAPEEERERQEHAEPAGGAEEPPREAEPLLKPAGPERSHRRRGPLIPANDADLIESMKQFFYYFADEVPFGSWNLLMRSLGLTDNEIEVAKAKTPYVREHFYEMMVTWTNKMGRKVSVNTFLNTLETTGLKSAREKIEDHLVASGKYIEGSVS
ncbi:tumor necrosis factor receptor superfamily member 10B-like [Pteronotus mesoamericanus]|uniref:tumor necrosis factor receptor superfamily member 10B-like n=1 Tax=Pteronotus mesoamericanus TaxID=1884717 RepID=UPI0023ED8ED8|nr:tumor necrosis factor receptor superfamily member 10B-like [Pteronotus parnellii mesoamericanus]